MGIFRRAGDREQRVARRAEATGFAERLAEADTHRPESMPAPAAPSPIAQASDLAELRDDLTARLSRLAERVDALDARVTSISTELANQLAELGSEADAASAAAETIRAGQTRLANEQARYQIAFRHELAELAERLRRT